MTTRRSRMDYEDLGEGLNNPICTDNQSTLVRKDFLQLLSTKVSGQPEVECGVSYEEAIRKTGYGWFHYRLLLVCGWALSSDAIEVLSISFVLPPATCDLQLTSADKGWLTAIIFVGMMVGGYVWGTIADVRGRRATLLWSLAVNSLGGLASSFVPSFGWFISLRFVSGLGVGGSMPVVFAYFTEFQPKEKRGSMIVFLASFWVTGNLIAAGLAWIIIPYGYLGDLVPNMPYNSWRLFLAVSTLPAITSAFTFACMPESPKYLMQTGREDEALQVFQSMHRHNNPSGKLLGISSLEHIQTKCGGSEGDSIPGVCCQTIKATVLKFWTATSNVFKSPHTRKSIVLVVIYFTLSFGYYGLYMWFPELFSRMEQYGGSACSTLNITQDVTSDTTDCDVSSQVYVKTFLTTVANIPGTVLAILLIDRIGRKILLAGSMVLSGLSVFFIAMLDNSTQTLIFSCVFGGITVIGWDALDVVQVELYPTEIRSTANGVMLGVGRVASITGNLVFGMMVDFYCLVPLCMAAVFLTVGGILAMFLPSTQDQDLA